MSSNYFRSEGDLRSETVLGIPVLTAQLTAEERSSYL